MSNIPLAQQNLPQQKLTLPQQNLLQQKLTLPQQTWTAQQIVGLGQNDYHVRSSRSLALATRWKNLAIDDTYIWGTITLKNTAGTISIHTTNTASTSNSSNKTNKVTATTSNQALSASAIKPKTSPIVHNAAVNKAAVNKPTISKKEQIIKTAIRLEDFHSSCTCVSQHSPCQHALALLFLLDDVNYSENNIFDNQSQNRARPDWLEEAFKDVTEQRFSHKTSSETVSDDDLSTKSTKREVMTKGLAELELWLSDLLRSGLNRFKDKPHEYTNAMAHRLVDSDLHNLARDINKFAMISKQQNFNQYSNWPELLLAEIGRIYALIQAFKKIDDLPKAIQGDVYMALGSPQINSESEVITDNWYILGKTTEQQGRYKELRTWLYGENSQRLAFITRRYKANERLNQHLLTGSSLNATLRFYTSQYPLKAEVNKEANISVTSSEAAPLLDFGNIAKAHENYRKAKSQNPWLRQFPMLLNNVTPVRQQNKIAKSKTKLDIWTIHDDEGYQLPVIRNFKYGWHLMSLGLSNQLNFLAEWNGYELKPVSLLQESHMYHMQAFRGLT